VPEGDEPERRKAMETDWRQRLAAGRVLATHDDWLFPAGTPLQPAAVLVPLVRRTEGYAIVFTQRAAHLHAHAGQISFPGGRQDPGDGDLWATALRETHEEIGVPPDAVEPLGCLEPIVSVTRFHVTPYAGFLPPDFPYRINAAEVATLFEVPLDPEIHRIEMREIPGGMRYPVHHYAYADHDIWGLTGHILHRFLQTIAP
jgi:8-oxo-dGTP pyrophosphatase MutT (NUDIX family)